MTRTDWDARPIYLVVALALVVLMLFIPTTAKGQNGVTVSIDAPDEAAHCTEVVARVNISEVTDINAYWFDLTYDATVLEVIGVEGGPEGVTDGQVDSTTFPVKLWFYCPIGTPGTVRVLGQLPPGTGVDGTGYLCDVHFHVIGEPCNTSALTLSNGRLWDSKSALIEPAEWEGDSVHVCAPPAPPGVPAVSDCGMVALTGFLAAMLIWMVRRRKVA
jgi:hypothetical protein